MNVGGLEKGIAELERRIGATVAKPGAELSGLALVAVKGGEVAYEGYFGRRYIDPEEGSRDLPVDALTKFRIASMSKPSVGIGAMILVERGLLDLDADISEYLDFELRNPHFPDAPISAAMLMSHLSSLRDAEIYNIPLGRSLSEFFLPGGSQYVGGGHFAKPEEAPAGSPGAGPGRRFCYCNLNYGVLATAMEKASGRRFDAFMREEVLLPLGLDASFNLLDLSDEGFAHLATLYAKAGPDEAWHPEGPWIPQFDDHRGKRPASGCRLSPGLGPEALEDYSLGTNGVLFSPQGGLRISALDLSKIMRLLQRGGEFGGRRILSPESVAAMTSSRWRYDADLGNGELYNGLSREVGLALMRITDAPGGDRLVASGGPRPWGHHGDAYGLLGGMLFEPGSGSGLVYLIGGTAYPPERLRGKFSSFFLWEEELHAAVIEELGIFKS
jgi:D-alanyl-D-alanine carboxypeptidase